INILNGVAASTATARTLTLSGTSTAANSVSGIIANNGAGVMSLAKSGAGTWLLSGANTYTGVTTISAGILKLGNANALGTTTGGTTLSGGTLDLNGQSIGAETITLSGTSALVNNSGTAASLSGRISGLRNSTTMGGTGDLTLSGVIASSGTSTTAWSKVGTGKLTLSGANTYSRALTISAGVVNIQHATALGTTAGATSVTAGAALEIQGGITVGAEALTLRGTGIGTAGALRNISGTNIYGGLVTLGAATRINSDAGTLTLSNTGTIAGTFALAVGGAGNTTINGIIGISSSPLTKDGAGILTLGGVNTYTGVTTLSDGTLSVATIGNGGVAGNLGTATNAAANLVFDGGTLRYTGASASSDRNFTITSGMLASFEVSANNLTLSGTSPASNGGLTKTGAGTLTLTASQLYTGTTTVSAGTLALSGAGAIADTSAVNIAAAAILNISAITASGETIASLTGVSGSSVVLGAKNLTTGDATSTSFGGVLSGTGGVLTKVGAGTLTLSGSNTHTGGTTISAGALSVPGSAALGLETNVLTIGSGATLKASDSFSTSRATTLGGAGTGVGGSIEVATGKTLDYTSGSSIGGSGSLIKTGAGTLFLEGTNAFTGGLYIQAGTLAANSQEALGAVPSAGSSNYGLHLYDGATFQIQVGSWATYRQLELVGNLVGSGGVDKVDVTGSFTHQRNGLVTGAGKLDLVGTGTLILTAANTYSGGTLIENGVLQVNNSSGSATGSGAVSVASGGTLSGLPSAPGYPGITGSVAGTVTLLSGGRLLASSGTTLTLGGLALSGGALESLQIGSLTSTSLVNISGSNLFTLPSSGTSTLDIVNTGAMGVGTYHLFDYTGTALSNISNVVLANSHSGLFNLSLVNNTANTSIDLAVTSITQQWKKGGTNTNWSTTGNWWASGVPDGVGAAAAFLDNSGTAGFGTTEAITLDGNKTVGSVIFQNAATAFTIGTATGQSLTMDETGSMATISVLSAPTSANHVMSVALVLTDNLTVNIAAGNFGLDLSGAISGSGKTLTKTGAGPLTLSGAAANTYSGLTQVAAGTLNLNKTAGVNAIGSGGLQIDSNATVVLLASNQIADSATVTVNGTLALGTFSETLAILAGGGAVTTSSGSVLTLNSATDSTFLGTINGAGGLAKAGSGTLTLNGSNTYTGGTAINAGTLQVGADHNLGGTGAITFGGGTLAFSAGFSSSRNLTLNSGGGTLDNSGSTATLTGVISGSGALTKTGIGTVQLTGTNSYTGATTINNGILQISNAAALGITGAGTTINAGGELKINGDGIVLNEAITLHGGSLCNSTGTNTFSGTLTLTANSMLDTDATKLIITSGISQSGGTYGLVKDGPGTVELKGTNTYTGETQVLAGTLSLFNGAAIVDTAALSLANTAGVTLELHTSETIGSLAGGGSSGGDVNLGSCTLTTGNASDTIFAGSISGSGFLVKAGSGTLTLSGSNSYTGGTTISAGALSVAASSALGLEANNLTISSGATLKLSDSFSTSRATTLGGAGGGAGGTFEVAAGKVLTYTSGSVIGGSGSLIKTGAGSLAIGGVDSYTGGTYIQAGTLVVNSGYALGPLPTLGNSNYAVHISAGATIQLATNSWSTDRQLELISGTANVDVTSGVSIVRNGAIYGSGAMNSMGAGTLIINNNGSNPNTYTGGTIIANGILQINNSGGSATGTGAVTVMSGGTLSGLTAQGASTGTTGSIAGSVAIQNGGKLLTLSGGTLTLGGLTLDAGSLNTFQLGTLTATSLVNVTGSNLFTLPGSGTSTINIVNTGAMGIGTYSLFNYSGTAFSDISTLALANLQSGLFNLSLVNNTANTSIDLSVSAILQQWKKGGSNTNWSTDGNWWVTGGGPNAAGAAAAFINNNPAGGGAAFAATEAVTIDTSKTVGTLAFQNSGTAFTLSASTGQTLTLDNNGVNASIQVFSAPTTANHGISAPIILLDDVTADIAAGSYGLNLSGVISGDQTVTKTGAGPLTLSGTAANTYTGLTEVAAGTLNLNKTAGIDAISSGGLQINSGATVTWLASNQIADAAGVTVNGTLALGVYSETIAGLDGRGAVTLGGSSVLTVSGDTDSTFFGSISGAGSLAKAGTGTLTLSGASSYTGGTAITGGTLQVGADNNLGGTGAITFDGGTLAFSAGFSSARNLTLNSGGATLDSNGSGVTLSGVISGSGTLTKIGSGTVALNTANSYTGATIINNGILQINNAAALGTSGAGTTINAGGELELNGNGLTLSEALTLNGGSLCNCAGTNTYSGTLTLTNHSTLDADAGTLSITNGIGESGGAYGVAKTGSGTIELRGTNTYTGTTHIQGGTLSLFNGAAVSNSGAIILDDVAGATLQLNASETIGSLAGGGTSGGNVVIGATTLTTGDASDSSFGGVISGSGGVLVKQGAGTMTLTGSNTYTGGTTISAGTLSVTASSALGLESNVLTISAGATLKAANSFSNSRVTTLGGTGGASSGGTIEVATGKTLDYTSGSS
ncbi:MAG: autotransporter-associated beta strand repeat-containing protein, partial [Verrucomicrobiota bacterium]